MRDYRIGRLKGRWVVMWNEPDGRRRRYRLEADTIKDPQATNDQQLLAAPARFELTTPDLEGPWFCLTGGRFAQISAFLQRRVLRLSTESGFAQVQRTNEQRLSQQPRLSCRQQERTLPNENYRQIRGEGRN